MDPGVRSIEIERLVQIALLAEHTGRQFVGESTIALGESGEIPVAGVGKWGSLAYGMQDFECRAPARCRFLDCFSPLLWLCNNLRH